MPNVRVQKSNYNYNARNVTAIPDHYVNLPAKISATHAIEEDGRKVIKGGLCLQDAHLPATRRTGVTPVKKASDLFSGVVFADVEVPYGETMVNVPVLVHGFVKTAALVKVPDDIGLGPDINAKPAVSSIILVD